MIPFENTLPYDHVMDIHDGKKRLLVFPCCRNRLVIVDADSDYLLADRAIR
ncbi:hypothetical protein [Paenibacillus sp. B1-33]|uniref:hypothetical protein n=1 Tax=unclassified Paenibacillus TaxID=185978 RepID=UPI003D2B26DF